MKRSIRVLTIILVISMIFGVFTGCNSNNSPAGTSTPTPVSTKTPTPSNNSTPTPDANDNGISKNGVFPLVKEKATLRAMVGTANYVEDFLTNDFTKYYEEYTNVHIDAEVVPSANRAEKLNLSLVSGDYPDMFIYMGISETTILSYATQGIFVPINSYVDEYAPNLAKILNDNPELDSALTYPDGNIYTFNQLEPSYNTIYPAKAWVYKPWLDKLNISMPVTTEDFYQMLKKFKTENPNGNGIDDIIPMAGATSGTGANIEMYLMTPFIYNDGAERLVKINGQIEAAFVQPEWKEGLLYINKLYKEGLIAPETFTQDSGARKTMVVGSDHPTVGVVTGNATSAFIDAGQKDRRDKNYFTLKPLQGPSGNAYCIYQPDVVSTNGQLVITDKAPNPELIVAWADGLLTYDMTMRSIYGVEGVNWRTAQDGEIGALGDKGLFVLINNWSDIQNFAWKRTAPAFRTAEQVAGEVYDPDGYENNTFLQAKLNYVGMEPPTSVRVGKTVLSADQAESISDVSSSIRSYVKESFARFVTGDRDIEKEWDAYVKEINNMGLDKYLEVYRKQAK